MTQNLRLVKRVLDQYQHNLDELSSSGSGSAGYYGVGYTTEAHARQVLWYISQYPKYVNWFKKDHALRKASRACGIPTVRHFDRIVKSVDIVNI